MTDREGPQTPAVADRAGEAATAVAQEASQVAGTAKDQAGKVAGEAQEQARQLVGGLREEIVGQVRSQSERLARGVRGAADDLERMGGQGDGDSTAAMVVQRLAGAGHGIADRLERQGPRGLWDEVENFARRRPGMFLAGAALAGFAVSRIGKGTAAANGDAAGGPPPVEPTSGRAVPATGPPAAARTRSAAEVGGTVGHAERYESDGGPSRLPHEVPPPPPGLHVSSSGVGEQGSQPDGGR
ncbi:hypothetical protein AB0442_16550 [Kitasatospora sp. NPDC085895]|uniref:hypothetical protein n=1 Tax=Kitasatospora sp. NPDC085895 TaxID=3155057 RepID=UPI00344E04EC